MSDSEKLLSYWTQGIAIVRAIDPPAGYAWMAYAVGGKAKDLLGNQMVHAATLVELLQKLGDMT